MTRISVTLYEDISTFMTSSLGILHITLRLQAKFVEKIKHILYFIIYVLSCSKNFGSLNVMEK